MNVWIHISKNPSVRRLKVRSISFSEIPSCQLGLIPFLPKPASPYRHLSGRLYLVEKSKDENYTTD